MVWLFLGALPRDSVPSFELDKKKKKDEILLLLLLEFPEKVPVY